MIRDEPPAAAAGGRPRDATIDERVLAATRELLLEVGWDDFSVRMVAARAGVGRASLSRRWNSKAELVLDAILGQTPDLTPFAGTDLAGWIEWVVRGSYELFSRRDVSEAVPGLLLTLRENDAVRRALWANFTTPAVALFAEHLAADTPAARRRAERDARAVLVMAAGAALVTTTVAVEDDTDALRRRIAELLSASIRAAPPH
ncbi:TetR/AcrR family transcriptional regulator [Mycobacterium sp. PSTR-4-N]|uniref:TetR/AcrR family transcriptional regulator n=1 Tax=Mycobacterium sp. PSTR-4-N TaxID=2917745 RepID=UPI001F150150|nr:helix-turn-helix domain-containing protein [Mycobacterium sp. PSTR-4-N]MCG7592886.1 TetR/AcrR family transcriptional regulator [Mycobacterium sp. PSTR-4-N]